MIPFQIQHPWLLSSVGGVLIGIAVSIVMVFNGKITGISGIFYRSVITPQKAQNWELSFLAGLLVGGTSLVFLTPSVFGVPATESPWISVLAGLLVGFGTRLGGGCTSGHGVCGLSRLSPRSMVATCIFIGFGVLTTAMLRHWWTL